MTDAAPSPPRVLPPVWFLLSLLAMGALHVWVPIVRWIHAPWRWGGVLFVVAGMVAASLGSRRFARAETPILPGAEPTVLFTDGLYAVSRNPLYVAMLLVQLGVATMLGTATPLTVIPLFAWFLDARFVRMEERMLEERFGDAYREYARRVRRWL